MMRFVLLMSVFTLGSSLLAADPSLTLNGVHNCCGGCERGILKAIESVKGASATVDDETVVITAKNQATLQKALASLLDAGYAGTGEGIEAPKSASSEKILKNATIVGAHLCCNKCVKAVEKAVATVPGVSGSQIESKAKEFTVQGEFQEGALIAALNAAGFHGRVK
jgi:copper chaperone CopZ